MISVKDFRRLHGERRMRSVETIEKVTHKITVNLLPGEGYGHGISKTTSLLKLEIKSPWNTQGEITSKFDFTLPNN